MKTLNLNIELSSIAMDSVSNAQQPTDVLSRVINFLSGKHDFMGNYNGCELSSKRNLGDSLILNEYELSYDNHTVQMEFIHFKPRGDWQVKGFKVV